MSDSTFHFVIAHEPNYKLKGAAPQALAALSQLCQGSGCLGLHPSLKTPRARANTGG